MSRATTGCGSSHSKVPDKQGITGAVRRFVMLLDLQRGRYRSIHWIGEVGLAAQNQPHWMGLPRTHSRCVPHFVPIPGPSPMR